MILITRADRYRQAIAAQGELAEAWWGLAMLKRELGQERDTVEACGKALRLPLTSQQRADLEGLQSLLKRAAETKSEEKK